MRRWHSYVALLVVVILGVGLSLINSRAVSSQQSLPTPNRVLEYHAQLAVGNIPYTAKHQAVSGGVLHAYLEGTGRGAAAAAPLGASSALPAPITRHTLGCRNVFPGPFPNIKVNQDCSFRRQAEEFIAINPTNPNNLIAGQNDSSIGFNHCGVDFSFDRGRTWGSYIPPFWQFILGDGHTSDAASDPAVAFDSRGNAYFTCVIFDVNAAANALVVAKSNAAFGGSFFHSPRVQAFQEFRTTPLGVVANDTSPNIFNDKEFINADQSATSPKRDNVYVVWTRFNLATGAGVGANSPIVFSQSTNGGDTWSPGINISGANAATCTAFSGSTNPNACDQDQGAWLEVGADGTLNVSFFNGNTPVLGKNQWLLTKCAATANCALAASWSTPVKITDDFGRQPFGPVASTACPGGGRQCLPPNGYRVQDETTGVVRVDPTNASRLFFVFADGRNIAANCNPLGSAATATPPCNNDVFLVVSTNSGATWGAPILVSDDGKKGAAQWQPWAAVGPNGKVFIAYYDRQYGDCETSGCNDITLAVTGNAGASFSHHRITTASMPNLVPANNPIQAGFLGDYMSVAADKHGVVIVWADTRPHTGSFPEEDIYMVRIRFEEDR